MKGVFLLALLVAGAVGNGETDANAAESSCEGSFAIPAFIRWCMIVFLVLMSGLFSGLTLGICGLDKLSLDVVVQSGTPKQRGYAEKILPVREDGNLLLCTLLLGNVAVNAMLSILMADVAGGMVGFLVSTAVIVIFGEICPQSVCSRFPLPIGARTAPIVRFLMFVIYPIAKPIALVLDRLLGEEMSAKYTKQELLKLLEIQKLEHNVLTKTEARLLEGALLFQGKTVGEIMTPIEKVYSISVDDRFTFDLLLEVFKKGHSRLPVYEGNKDNIVGLIFAKDLMMISAEDEVPVRTIMQCHSRTLQTVWDDSSLETMFTNFKQWRSHLALVQTVDNEGDGDPVPVVTGIITLEDIIEELIEEEIVDETDNFESNMENTRVNQQDTIAALFNMFDTRVHSGFQTLSDQESVAIHTFLKATFVDTFAQLSSESMATLISMSKVVHVTHPEDGGAKDPEPIFAAGENYEMAVLVLQGRVEVESGKEKFKARLGPFTFLGGVALTGAETTFCADFTCVPTSTIRYLIISRNDFQDVIAAQPTVPAKRHSAGTHILQLHKTTSARLRSQKKSSRDDSVGAFAFFPSADTVIEMDSMQGGLEKTKATAASMPEVQNPSFQTQASVPGSRSRVGDVTSNGVFWKSSGNLDDDGIL